MKSATETETGLIVKIFIGCPMTSEIKLHLNNSAAWQQAKIEGKSNSLFLTEIHHDNKEYIGYYVDKASITLAEVQESEKRLLIALTTLCPKIQQKHFAAKIFPQILVS